jgi:HD-GYP domain-containing protein (c-di-GMP phosphodiesterase class II)
MQTEEDNFLNDVRLPVAELRRGLFVARLDRPWRDSPFLFQGFVVRSDKELEQIRALCEWIEVTPERSEPAAWREVPKEAQSPAGRPPTGDPAAMSRPRTMPPSKASAPTVPDKLARLMAERMAAAGRGAPAASTNASASAPAAPVRGVGWFRAPRGQIPLPPGARAARTVQTQPATRPVDVALLPANVQPVIYAEPVPVSHELPHASASALTASSSLQMHLRVLRASGTASCAELVDCAQQLAVSVAHSPDALQWVARMRSRDTALHEHGVRVAVYMMAIGRHLGFPPDELAKLGQIGLLLDVGKLFVDPALLMRAAPLNDDERREVHSHVERGLERLRGSESLSAWVLEGIAHHHERLDGSGYPAGLRDREISLQGAIAAVADKFSRMISHWPYAPAMTAFEALLAMRRIAGAKLHGPIFEHFLQAVGVMPTGSLVELSNGQVAVVTRQNRVNRLEPEVLVLTDAAKQILREPVEFDLRQAGAPAGSRRLSIVGSLPDGAFGINLSSLYAG